MYDQMKLVLRLLRYQQDKVVASDWRQMIRCARSYLICLLLACWVPFGYASVESDQERLNQIAQLSDRDNTDALHQLLAWQKKLPDNTPATLKLEGLKLLVTLYDDAGLKSSSYDTIAAFLKLARSENQQDYLALAETADAMRLLNTGQVDQASARMKAILQAHQDSHNPEVRMAMNNALGQVYYLMGHADVALSYFLEALRWSDQLPLRHESAKINRLSSVANLYLVMRHPEKADQTLQEALEDKRPEQFPKAAARIFINRGVYFSLEGRHRDAFQSYQRALQLGRTAGVPSLEALAAVNIANYYISQKDYHAAESFARESLETASSIQDQAAIAGAKMNLGYALGGQGNIKTGMMYINEAIGFFQTAKHRPELEIIYGEIAEMYERAHLYRDALMAMKAQRAVSNELFQKNRAWAVATLQEQFDTEQRQKKIALLEKENDLKDADIRFRHYQQIAVLLGLVLVLMGGVFIFVLYRRGQAMNQTLQKMNEELAFYAAHDPLTGLYNRRSFVEKMASDIAAGTTERRQHQRDQPDCLILADIDHFKDINDRWGHAFGDKVLKEVARRLETTTRDTDMVLRWGGEEFLIFSPNATPSNITGLVERLLQAVALPPISIGEVTITVTVSAGFISFPFSGIAEEKFDWEKALNLADNALYLAKQRGRNRAYGLTKLLAPYEQAQTMLETDLEAAIKHQLVESVEVLGVAGIDSAHHSSHSTPQVAAEN